MQPPPEECQICNKKIINKFIDLKLIVFTATEEEKIKWKYLCGDAPYKRWVCDECDKIYIKYKLNDFYTKYGIEVIKQLRKIN